MNEIMQTENVQSIGAARLADLFLAGAVNLEAGKEWINELNVFPVPDGDTGTNMTLTIKSAVAEVENLDETSRSMRDVLKAISSGSLRGARGNSGVILSQLLRGFGKVARDNDEINVEITARAFERAVETAYKAVMKPKEGTILTVAKGVADKAKELSANGVTDFDVFIPEVIAYGEEVLAKTPDMLPVLKQAGVVDSGGQGLIEFLKGCYNGFLGKEIVPVAAEQAGAEGEASVPEVPAEPEIKYVYRTAFTIVTDKDFNKASGKSLRKYLESLGEDVVCEQTDTTVEVKLNTNDPGLAIQKGILYGDLTGLVVENRKLEKEGSAQAASAAESAPAEAPAEESSEEAEQEMPHKDIGFITVSVGDGIEEIFRGLGVDYVIAGGQTMNPSTDDILNAVNKVNADTIYILPNNKNIVMAARQAADLTEDKKVIVMPSRTVPQGITALFNFNPNISEESLVGAMGDAMGNVHTAMVTYAARDSEFDGHAIHAGEYLALLDGSLIGSFTNTRTLFKELSWAIDDFHPEFITIYYGEDVTEEEAVADAETITGNFPDAEVNVVNGGQPVYYYMISAE